MAEIDVSGETGLLRSLGLHRKTLRSWAMYDWANSAFATTIMAAVLPIYYVQVAGATLESNVALSYWAYKQDGDAEKVVPLTARYPSDEPRGGGFALDAMATYEKWKANREATVDA